MLTASGVGADDLAADVGIPWGPPTSELPFPPVPIRLPRSEYTAVGREVVGYWSWSLARFVTANEAAPNLPVLERMQQKENRSNDVYRIVWNDHTEFFDSRTAAVIRAYRVAERLLFELDSRGESLMRCSSEGWLPGQIASYLRRRHRVGPAMAPTLDGIRYAYPADRQDVRMIAAWLDGIVSAEEDAGADARHAALVTTVLRNRGYGRGQALARLWVGGR